ncbi:hypothetical protein AK812_SmicGene35134 [Symbiodinium microadriaticum]|uniref:Uncharacterized protein n=1 Tax=Symbiodinium microadriaticum TaxID=2951 RepID=A0A1Q9CM64_SYMMI|nr:hypothetical protein AK812_SmicGene35134 [Symbiodinium microadriaticum]
MHQATQRSRVISVPVYREALPSLTVLSRRSAGGLGRSNYAYHHSGATPLMCSILTSSFQATAVLLAAGAKADIRNYRGKNAEELALEMSAPSHVLSALRSARDST